MKRFVFFALLSALLPTGAALADPGINFDQALQTGPAGTEVFFSGEITSPDDLYSLDSAPITIDPTLFTPDYSDFLNNYPLTVDPADPYGVLGSPVQLFGVSILPGTPAGTYTGSFSLTGTDMTTSAPYATAPLYFQVQVSPNVAAVPEASPLALCGFIGLGLLALTAHRRRAQASA